MGRALSAGVRFFQYRDKTGTRRSIYETALQLAKLAREAEALFIVNDHADIAVAVDADGVHVGQDDLPPEAARAMVGPDRIIGVSTHSREQALLAERSGADYIGFGPLFPTLTKDAGAVQGLKALTIIRQSVRIPIIVIGGINHENCASAMEAGADGVAVISAILYADDLQKAARDMMSFVEEARIQHLQNRPRMNADQRG